MQVSSFATAAHNFATPTREQAALRERSLINVLPLIKCLEMDHRRLVVLDFDDTLIDGHTRGSWQGSCSDLQCSVRPLFQQMLWHCLNNGLSVGIATFSTQEALIRELLTKCLPSLAVHSKNVFIRGPRLEDNLRRPSGVNKMEGPCKKFILQALMADFNAHHPSNIVTGDEVFFVDDSQENVVAAAQIPGLKAVHFSPGHDSDRFLADCMDCLK